MNNTFQTPFFRYICRYAIKRIIILQNMSDKVILIKNLE